MNCEEALRLLQEHLDGAGLPAGAAAHLAECDACAASSPGLREVHDLLLAEPDLSWSPELTRSVADRIRAENARARRWGLAAAVLLFLAAGLGFTLLADAEALAGADTGLAGIPYPRSAGEALEAFTDGLGAAAGALTRLPEESPVALGAGFGAAGLALLLLVNALVIGRLRPAGRRS